MHFVDAKGILTGGKGHYGMNVYRGCSHGCIYCDSRSTCYQFSHAFEDIEVKRNAPELLDTFLENGAISRAQYDKSLGDLTVKMGIDPEER